MAVSNKPLHFFKVVLQQTIVDKSLIIPELFVHRFGDELSDVAMIRAPNGRVWHVGLKREGRKICFYHGWDEFVNYHSICVGYFLIFKYMRNSSFDVIVLDTTCCEIKYPYNGENKPEGEIKLEKDVAEAVEKVVDEDGNTTGSKIETPCLKRKNVPRRTKSACKGPPSSSKQTRAKRLPQSAKRQCVRTQLNTEDKGDWTLFDKKGIIVSNKFSSYNPKERAKLIKACRFFKPKVPAFMILVRSKGLTNRNIFVPMKFALKYFNEDIRSVNFQVIDGQTQPVLINWRNFGGPVIKFSKVVWKNLSIKRLRNGVKKLKAGDVCLAEMIRKKDPVFKLTLYPCTS